MSREALAAREATGRIERDQVDVGINPAQQFDQAVGGLRRVIFPRDQRPLEENPFAGHLAVGAAGVDQRGQGPAFACGNQSHSLFLRRTMEADGEAVGPLFVGESQDAWHHAHRANRDFAWPDPDAAHLGNHAQGGDHGVIIVKGLAHAHHHEVPEVSFRVDRPQHAARMQHLCDDFAGAEMPDEPHLARGAKNATHRTPRLGAHANRVAAVVAHQHRFDGLAVPQAQEKFSSQPVGAADFVHELRLIEEKPPALAHRIFHPALKRPGKFARGEVEGAIAMKRPPERFRVMRLHSVCRQNLDELGKSEIVQ